MSWSWTRESSWIKHIHFHQATNCWRDDFNKLPKFWGIPKKLNAIPSGGYNKAVKINSGWLATNIYLWCMMLNTVDKNSRCQPFTQEAILQVEEQGFEAGWLNSIFPPSASCVTSLSFSIFICEMGVIIMYSSRVLIIFKKCFSIYSCIQ